MQYNTHVSIIVPAHNAAEYISDTIYSVCAQTAKNWELIIVDDGSTDTTSECVMRLAADDARIKLVRQVNSGVSSARNNGIKCSNVNAPYIVFLDADDTWPSDTLQHLIQTIERTPNAVGVHGVARYVDRLGNSIHAGRAESVSMYRWFAAGKHLAMCSPDACTSFEVLAYRNCIFVGTLLLKRQVLNKVGVFESSYKLCEDWHLWLRVTQQGNIAFTNKIVLNYRQHANNATINEKRLHEAELCMRNQLLQAYGAATPFGKSLKRGLQFSERRYSIDKLASAGHCFMQLRLITALKLFRRCVISYLRSIGFINLAGY